MCRPKCKKTTTDYHGAAGQRLFSSQTAVSRSQKYLKDTFLPPPECKNTLIDTYIKHFKTSVKQYAAPANLPDTLFYYTFAHMPPTRTAHNHIQSRIQKAWKRTAN